MNSALIPTTTGATVYCEPTCTRQQLREAATAQKKAEAQTAKVAAELLAKKREADRAIPSQDTRHETLLRGAARMAKKLARDNDRRGAELARLADEGAALLNQVRQLTAAVAKPASDPLADAIDKAAKSLLKALPGCFADGEEARAFAKHSLPLTEARREATRQADARAKTAKQRSATARKLGVTLERAAALAFGGDSDGLKRLFDCGEF